MNNKDEDSYSEALKVLHSELAFYFPGEKMVDNEAAAKVA